MYVLCRKLQNIRESIMRCNKNQVRDLVDLAKNEERYTNTLHDQLDKDPANHTLLELATLARREAMKARWDEESLICQKPRVKWLKEGDLNTKLFYSMVK